jgi:hypothetical protein
MKLLKKFEKSGHFLFLILTSFLFFILRLPSLFEPLWYGDEGIYQVLGTSLNHGKLLYKEIFDNKPPLLYWLYSFFHSDQFSIRLMSLIFGVFSVWVFFLLSKKLFKDSKNIPYLTTIIFALLFALPTLEGNIANAENFMLLPILASAFLITNQKRFFAAGLLLGIAFLFKIVAVFDLAAFFVFSLILNFNSLKKEVKLLPFAVGFILPIFFVVLFFIFKNSFIDFVKAIFISNISYVGYGNRIGSLPILMFIKLILLGTFIYFIFKKRHVIGHSSLFILIWFAFSLFNAFFSQRPYTHYLLVLIPSLSLMVGLILFDKKYQKFTFVIFLAALLIIAKGFGIPRFDKSIKYYQNFTSFLMGGKTMDSYQRFFDHKTPADYEMARFIKPKLSKNDTVFVWGNNAQLYQLLGVVAPTKYVVAYHILNYKDGAISTKSALETKKPKFIVILPNEGQIPFALTNYSLKIDINKASIYERAF